MFRSLSSVAIAWGGFPANALVISRSAACSSPQSIARAATLRWRIDLVGSASSRLRVNSAAADSCSKADRRKDWTVAGGAPRSLATSACSARAMAFWCRSWMLFMLGKCGHKGFQTQYRLYFCTMKTCPSFPWFCFFTRKHRSPKLTVANSHSWRTWACPA
jgi:hypothetical protein